MPDRRSSVTSSNTTLTSSSASESVPPPLSHRPSFPSQRSQAGLKRVYSTGDPNDASYYQYINDVEETVSRKSGEVDIEKGEHSKPEERVITHQSSRTSIANGRGDSEKQEIVVGWDGPDDPENPRNWPMSRKWTATFVVSSFGLVSTISTSMVAPCLTDIASQFGITNEVESQLTLSIFVLAYAIGPLILAPTSEVYGRVRALQLPNMLFLAFNLACGFAQNKGQLMAFRFLAGLGGSAPLGVGGGVLADVWSPDQRGLSVSIYSLAPLLGPAVGPIAGGFITENTTWRWTFWATTMADAIVQFLGIIFLRESYALLLLQRKAAKLNKESGQEIYIGPGATQHHTIGHVLRHSLIRPAKMLATQPIVQALAIYMAFIYGLMYLVLSTFPTLWTTVYGESVGTGSLNYLSLGIGFLLGSQIPAHLNDSIYRRLKARNSGLGTPEFRVPLMIPGSLLVPFGLFIYGWTAQYHTHWIFPNLGAAIFAAGVVMCFQCMQTYLIEAYTTFAASAVAAATVLRSLAGFGFPLFAPSMYDSLQHGWGNSLVAFIAIGLGIPAPFLLWAFGEKLRGKSPYAAGTTLNG